VKQTAYLHVHIDTRKSPPEVYAAGIYHSSSLIVESWEHAALVLKEEACDFETAMNLLADMVRQCDHYAWLRPYLFPTLQPQPQ
jgi:hypothetical protein